MFEVPTAAQVARRHRQVGEYRVSEGMEPLPAEAQPHLTVTCPVCLTSLRAALDQVGQQLICPDCDTPVVVPPPVPMEHKRSLLGVPVEQYALWDEVDQSAAGPRPADQVYVPVTCPVCGTFMQVLEDLVGQEIVCPDCREPMMVSRPIKAEKKGTVPVAQLGEYALHEEAETPSADAQEAERTLFPLHCPLCDSLMYAGRDQVGQEIVCRDCEAYFVVPPPPPPKRKLDLRSQAGEVYDVGDSIEVPEYKPLVFTAGWRLRPGAESPADRHTQADWLRTRPPPRWTFFSGIFGFPAYRGSWQRWLGLSLGAMVPLQLIGNAVVLARAGPGKEWAIGLTYSGLAFVLGTIWSIIASAQYLAILRDTADGCHEIENWPEAMFLDWLGDAFYLINSLALSVIAGLGIARVLHLAGLVSWPGVPATLLILFPILLLAFLEMDSPLNPMSLPVWRSLLTSWWVWGLFYVETTVLIAAVSFLGTLAATYVPVLGMALAAPLLVAALMIYFRLLGRLAWRCGRAAPRDKRPAAGSDPSDDQKDQ